MSEYRREKRIPDVFEVSCNLGAQLFNVFAMDYENNYCEHLCWQCYFL